VKLLDVNLLLYAVDETSPCHGRARPWLDQVMSGSETVALPWLTLTAFVRLTTRAAVFVTPLSADAALDYVEQWLLQPCATVVHPTFRHASIMRDLLRAAGTAGNRVSDAHLAALAIEHGATLCSRDADFARFPGLRWEDPLRS
jgi:toxin-antitoxin system PIN domain toxin